MSTSDMCWWFGALVGMFGSLWFGMHPEDYWIYLPMWGIAGSLVGACLALDKPRKRRKS